MLFWKRWCMKYSSVCSHFLSCDLFSSASWCCLCLAPRLSQEKGIRLMWLNCQHYCLSVMSNDRTTATCSAGSQACWNEPCCRWYEIFLFLPLYNVECFQSLWWKDDCESGLQHEAPEGGSRDIRACDWQLETGMKQLGIHSRRWVSLRWASLSSLIASSLSANLKSVVRCNAIPLYLYAVLV